MIVELKDKSLHKSTRPSSLYHMTSVEDGGDGRRARANELQRNYGNQKTGQLWSSLEGQADGSKGMLKPPYAALFSMLAIEAERGGHQQRLWQSFESLAPGQRQAVLASVAGSDERLEHMMLKQIDWQTLHANIEAMKSVQLEDDEPEREGSLNHGGAQAVSVTHAYAGLLSPYKEIALWLNYKANKQGETALMTRFEQLSIPRRKAAIIRMAGGQRLQFKAFTKNMTIVDQLKEWVDWNKMNEAIQDAERMKAEEAEELSAAAEQSGGSTVPDSEHDKHDEEQGLPGSRPDDTGDYAWLPQLMSSEEQNEQKSSVHAWHTQISDPAYLGWLLFGGERKQPDPAKAKAGKLQADAPHAIVDRLLQIDQKQSAKKQAAARDHGLQLLGYHSVRQCYVHLLAAIVGLLFERGVMEREKPFIVIIEQLGLFMNKAIPTKQMIADKLNAHP